MPYYPVLCQISAHFGAWQDLAWPIAQGPPAPGAGAPAGGAAAAVATVDPIVGQEVVVVFEEPQLGIRLEDTMTATMGSVLVVSEPVAPAAQAKVGSPHSAPHPFLRLTADLSISFHPSVHPSAHH